MAKPQLAKKSLDFRDPVATKWFKDTTTNGLGTTYILLFCKKCLKRKYLTNLLDQILKLVIAMPFEMIFSTAHCDIPFRESIGYFMYNCHKYFQFPNLLQEVPIGTL